MAYTDIITAKKQELESLIESENAVTDYILTQYAQLVLSLLTSLSGTSISEAQVKSAIESSVNIDELETLLTSIRDRLMPDGTTFVSLGASAGGNLKSTAGRVHAFTVENTVSSTRWIQFFNKNSSPATNDVPIRKYPVFPSGAAGNGFIAIGQEILGGGIVFTTGVSWGISSTSRTYTAATNTDCDLTIRWS